MIMSLCRMARFAARTDHLGKVARWSDVRRERLTARRLRRLLRFAGRRSRFYRRLYQGLDLRRVRLEDLPPVTKEMLREHFDDVLTDPSIDRAGVADFIANPANLGTWYRGRYAASHTSGSQGPPLFIVQDRAAIQLLFSMMSARANAGTRPGPLEGIRRIRDPARIAVVALHRGFYPSSAAFEFMAEETRPFTRVEWFSIADPALIPKLSEFQPHSLVGYASVLESLALESDRLGLRHLRQIANSSEQLTSRARRRIEAAFGVPVVDHYGLGECLFLSDGCPTDGGAHVNTDWAILENVDDDHRPVPPGEPGRKVLVTNLANRVQPFIRYEVPDRVVMATEPCRCGSRLPRIARIEGRSAEALLITGADGRQRPLPGVAFHDAIDHLANVREWRATQTVADHVRLELELLPGASSHVDTTALLGRLRANGLPEAITVGVEFVRGLGPDPRTGKMRRIVSVVPAVDQP
ncbi:MAG: phenylacetate--CoA ligase family protein [Pirellulales bacterium]